MSGFDDELDAALSGGGFDAELSAALSAPPSKSEESNPAEREPDADVDDSGPPTQQSILGPLLAARAQMGGGPEPIERAAQAAVSAYTPSVFKGASGVGRLVADAGNQALSGGVIGGASDLRNTSVEDAGLLERLLSAGRESLRGAGLAGGASAALGAVGRTAEPVAGWLGDRARDVVAGVNASAAKDVARREGIAAVPKRFGQALESEVQSPWYGWSAGRYNRELAKRAGGEGAAVQDALRQASSEGVDAFAPGGMQNAAARVRAEAAALDGAVADDMIAKRESLNKLADRLESGLTGEEVLSDLVGKKSEIQAFGHSGGAGTVPETASKEAHAAAGRIMRDELRGAMSYATPETEQAWRAANDHYARLKMLEELTQNKAAGEFTAGNVGATLAGGVIGAAGGALGGAMSEDFSPLGGAVGGFAAGSGIGAGATNSAVRQAVGTWGSDVAANAARGVQRLGAASPAIGGLAGRAAESFRSSRGHLSTQAVEQALSSNPAALGSYAAQLQAAQQRGELTEQIERLQDDPQFRQRLAQLTARRL